MIRALSVSLVLVLGCTGKTPAKTDGGDGASARSEPAGEPAPGKGHIAAPLAGLELGPECLKFVELVQRECPDGSTLHRCVQAHHRLSELAALAPGKDGTHGKHDLLCKGELETFEIRRGAAGGG